jgi:hypothetical protein
MEDSCTSFQSLHNMYSIYDNVVWITVGKWQNCLESFGCFSQTWYHAISMQDGGYVDFCFDAKEYSCRSENLNDQIVDRMNEISFQIACIWFSSVAVSILNVLDWMFKFTLWQYAIIIKSIGHICKEINSRYSHDCQHVAELSELFVNLTELIEQ